MPNWCMNSVSLTHDDPAQLKRAADAFNGDGLMQEFHPCPDDLLSTMSGSYAADDPRQAELEATMKANVEKHGFTNWYDWKVAKWGTKWDVSADGNDPVEPEGNHLHLSFDSAWGPPVKFYEHLESLGFGVVAYYHEPGCAFCGRYTDGVDDYYDLAEGSKAAKEDVPQDILDEMGIIESMEAWEEDEEGDDKVPDPDQPIEVGNEDHGGLRYSGTARGALQLAADLRPLVEKTDAPNYISDFVFALEVRCQVLGLLDGDFNRVGPASTATE